MGALEWKRWVEANPPNTLRAKGVEKEEEEEEEEEEKILLYMFTNNVRPQ
jgi:hypothetical protein